MGDENSAEETGQVVLSELTDEDLLIIFCLQNKISKTAIDELLKRGFDSSEALSLVDIEDLVTPKIPVGQRRLILHVAWALKTKATSAQTPLGVPSTEGTASVAAATNETSLTDSSGIHRSATGETTGANRPVVPANSQTPVAGVHSSATNNTASDLYQHVNGLLQEQQRLLTSNLTTNSHVQPSGSSFVGCR